MKQRISIGWFAAGVIAVASMVLASFSNGPATDVSEQLNYSQRGSLNWDDYQNRVGVISLYKAMTFSGISYKLNQDENRKVTLDVNAYFDPTKSWVNVDSKTNILLNHEQRHFDITAVYAAKVRKELDHFVGMDIATFMDAKNSAVVKQTFNRIYDEMEAKQRSYDQSTKHSTDIANQKKWDLWIDDQMVTLGMKPTQLPLVDQKPEAITADSSKSSPSKTGYRGR